MIRPYSIAYLQQHRAKQLIQHIGARVVERDRTSNDLNDTVIQSMQGVLLLTESAADKFTGGHDSTEKEQLTNAFRYANKALIKGRDRVQTLRDGSNEELVDKFDTLAEDEMTTPIIVRQSGISRDVHTAVKDELFAVGREALRNAIREHRAKEIIVHLIYRKRELVVEVSDNGPATLTNASSIDNHTGQNTLNNLCRRAEQIGAKCYVERRPGANLVRISIPSKLAYQKINGNM